MLTVLLGVAVVYAAVCLALFLLQRSMIYFPQPRRAPATAPLLSFRRRRTSGARHDRASAKASVPSSTSAATPRMSRRACRA
jgi:hypothetical protein